MASTPTTSPMPSSTDLLVTPLTHDLMTPRTRDASDDAQKSRQNTKSMPRVHGLDEIKPFLKKIGKIVTEEC